MTDKEIIEEIGPLDGWTKCACNDPECGVWYSPTSTSDEPSLGIESDYLNDRNAIIPLIEKEILRGEMEIEFSRHLHLVIFKFELNSINQLALADALRMFLYATPRQLCEALLRVLNKWKD